VSDQQVDSTPFALAVRSLLLFFAQSYRDFFGFADPPLHDPCAVAFVAAPSLFRTVFANVSVITGEGMAAGRTVCDMHGVLKRAPNVHVATHMDVPAFWARMMQAVRAADARSPMNNTR
jgi:purine nucleosidase/pyrimidine-specific ribonucleoside hydrolase